MSLPCHGRAPLSSRLGVFLSVEEEPPTAYYIWGFYDLLAPIPTPPFWASQFLKVASADSLPDAVAGPRYEDGLEMGSTVSTAPRIGPLGAFTVGRFLSLGRNWAWLSAF
jgi:hypothetical protein